MAQDVQRLLLQIDASATLLRQEVARARNDIDGFADRGAARLKEIDDGFMGMGNAANMATAKLAGFAAGLLSVGQAASFMVRANADMQRLSAMLEVATGSAGSAATAMSQLQSFAAETPFTLGQVTEAYIKLKNLGLDPSTEALRSFGNTSAAMGKDIMQFIEAVADAATGEFERLKEFGIKTSTEGDKVKFTFQGVTTTVQNTAQAITGYLRGLGDESGVFAGSMAKQMDTIDGKLSNLDDAASRLATTLGKMGFNAAFIKTLDYLTNTMSGMAAVLQSRGFKGLFASQSDILQAATPKGNAELLKGRREAAASELEAARNFRVLGNPQPQMVANAKAAFDARNREYVEFVRANPDVADPMMRFGLNANGRVGAVPVAQTPASSKKTKTKAAKNPANDPFVIRARRGDFDVPVSDPVDAFTQAQMPIQEIKIDMAAIEKSVAGISSVKLISAESVALADQFAENLSSGLSQAIINGQSLGSALVNSIKAAAAELVASGLLNLLSGGKRGNSFGESLVGIASLFGGFRETGGSVMPGKAYVVGEKRAELFVPSTSGYITPRVPSEKDGSGQQSVTVTVNPSPLFITTVAQGAQAAAQETLRKSSRQRMPMSAGV
jgi:hypothetical protein